MPTRPSQRSTGQSSMRQIRRRDRHGRGLRGPLAPPQVPLARTRAERFDEFVMDAVESLEHHWPAELSGVEFAVEDVPPVDSVHEHRPRGDGDPVPLGRLAPPEGGRPRRIVVYRRPLEARAGGDELGSLVYEVVVEEFANLLGLEPEAVDPSYGTGDE